MYVTESREEKLKEPLSGIIIRILLELLLIVSHHVSYVFLWMQGAGCSVDCCKGQVVLVLIVVRGRLYHY